MDADTFSPQRSKEIVDILDMYRFITFGLKKLPAGHELQNHFHAKFPGFDGNNEGAEMIYVEYFIDKSDRFTELKANGYNPHSPMLGKYRSMLEAWHAMGDYSAGAELSEEQIRTLLEA